MPSGMTATANTESGVPALAGCFTVMASIGARFDIRRRGCSNPGPDRCQSRESCPVRWAGGHDRLDRGTARPAGSIRWKSGGVLWARIASCVRGDGVLTVMASIGDRSCWLVRSD